MDVVEIDAIDAEPFQRSFERLAHVGRAVVEYALALGRAADREFGRERDLLARAGIFAEETADDILAQAHAVDIGGVPEVDAVIERLCEASSEFASLVAP